MDKTKTKTRKPKNKRSRFPYTAKKGKIVSNMAIKKEVSRQLSKNIEVKERQASLSMKCLYPQPAMTGMAANGLFVLTPYDSAGLVSGSTIQILQGTGQGSRIGNQIRLKYAELRGVIVPIGLIPELNPAPRPLEVQIIIFKIKDLKNGNAFANIENVINNDFYQSNNAAEGADGTLVNLVQTVNKDNVHVYYRKTFKLGFAAGQAGGSIASNDFNYNKKFYINLTKYLPQNIRFDDNTEMPSVNHVYCWIAPFRADNSVQVGNFYGCTCDWELSYKYTDA